MSANQVLDRVSLWKRMVALWPYVLIAISLAGLAYKFLTGSR